MAARFCRQCDGTFDESCEFCPRDGARLVTIRDGDESATQDGDPLLGQVVDGRYRVLACIGRGGMGAVYRALQITTQRDVALKVIRSGLPADASLRFMREARATSALRSLHTVTIYEFGQTADGMPYLVLELLEGRGLDGVLKAEGCVPWPRAVRIVAQMAESLEEAHTKGIIHRDLKPANVFLARIGSHAEFVKVLDFGVAKVQSTTLGSDVTGTGMVLGTPTYMSPEQARGDELDARSDLYAVGVILYEMLAGRPPFHAQQPLAVLMKHCQDSPPPIRDCPQGSSLPPALVTLLERLLAKRVSERLENAAALRREADQLLGATSDPLAISAPLGGQDTTPPAAEPRAAQASAAADASLPPTLGLSPTDAQADAGCAPPLSADDSVGSAPTLVAMSVDSEPSDLADQTPTVPSDPAVDTHGLSLALGATGSTPGSSSVRGLAALGPLSPIEDSGLTADLRSPREPPPLLSEEVTRPRAHTSWAQAGETESGSHVDGFRRASSGRRRLVWAAVAVVVLVVLGGGAAVALLDLGESGPGMAFDDPHESSVSPDPLGDGQERKKRDLPSRGVAHATRPVGEPQEPTTAPPASGAQPAAASHRPSVASSTTAAQGAASRGSEVARTTDQPGAQPSIIGAGPSAGGAPPPRPSDTPATIWLRSLPPGAMVVGSDGKHLGRTPLELPVPAEPTLLSLRLKDHRPGTHRLLPAASEPVVVRLAPRPRPHPRAARVAKQPAPRPRPTPAARSASSPPPPPGDDLMQELMD